MSSELVIFCSISALRINLPFLLALPHRSPSPPDELSTVFVDNSPDLSPFVPLGLREVTNGVLAANFGYALVGLALEFNRR